MGRVNALCFIAGAIIGVIVVIAIACYVEANNK